MVWDLVLDDDGDDAVAVTVVVAVVAAGGGDDDGGGDGDAALLLLDRLPSHLLSRARDALYAPTTSFRLFLVFL